MNKNAYIRSEILEMDYNMAVFGHVLQRGASSAHNNGGWGAGLGCFLAILVFYLVFQSKKQ